MWQVPSSISYFCQILSKLKIWLETWLRLPSKSDHWYGRRKVNKLAWWNIWLGHTSHLHKKTFGLLRLYWKETWSRPFKRFGNFSDTHRPERQIAGGIANLSRGFYVHIWRYETVDQAHSERRDQKTQEQAEGRPEVRWQK